VTAAPSRDALRSTLDEVADRLGLSAAEKVALSERLATHLARRARRTPRLDRRNPGDGRHRPGARPIWGIDMGKRTDPRTRFEAKVDRSGTCHRWTGTVLDTGYGQFWLDGKHRRAHIVALELDGVTVPPGMTVDHVAARGCRYKDCVRIDHLEIVSQRENNLRSTGMGGVNARKQECAHGHAFDEQNTRLVARGERICRICARAHRAEQRARRRSAQ
jgi:hypothetical protein